MKEVCEMTEAQADEEIFKPLEEMGLITWNRKTGMISLTDVGIQVGGTLFPEHVKNKEKCKPPSISLPTRKSNQT